MTPEQFIQSYEKALAAQEWELVAPLMHPDCTVTFSSGRIHEGKAAVEKAFRGNFAMIQDEHYEMSDVNWIVKSESFAVFTFIYEWSGTINERAASGNGRGTSSLVKEGGVWLLTSEHLGVKDAD